MQNTTYRRTKSWGIAAGCCLALEALHIPLVAAQVTPSTPLTYEECIRKQKEFRDQAKQAGNRAWEIVKAAAGAVFSTRESRELYDRADQLHKMADQLKCVWRAGRGDQTAKSRAID